MVLKVTSKNAIDFIGHNFDPDRIEIEMEIEM
jgi:hypothetical protein